MTTTPLDTISPDDVPELRRDPVEAQALRDAADIVDDVRAHGEKAVREHCVRLGDLEGDELLIRGAEELEDALESLEPDKRQVLERTARRIESFARAQLDSIDAIDVPISGGRAGHEIAPVERAGCYAPGGRFPLPSSVLMTAVTARVAGVDEIWVASPGPDEVTLAAASIAGADAVLAAGGAQAIAAFGYGAGEVPACDAVVGPGNQWVTAAKQLVSGRVRIDMLAGPSELVVLTDGSSSAEVVAADLLAQAEHDPQALPILVSTDADFIDAVNAELSAQLDDLPTEETARAALDNGFAVDAPDLESAAEVCNRLAPEHLEVILEPDALEQGRAMLDQYGALFIGHDTAEVFGDYGAGPNHTLPTGGTARSMAGLSVLTFLRVRTWMEIHDRDAAAQLIHDSAALARLEGLEAHARSAERRRDAHESS